MVEKVLEFVQIVPCALVGQEQEMLKLSCLCFPGIYSMTEGSSVAFVKPLLLLNISKVVVDNAKQW